MSARTWGYDESVIGRNFDSLEAFEEAARHEETIYADQTLVDAHVYRIPVRQFGREEWDGDQMYPCAMGERPGRGYVKVIVAERADVDPTEEVTQ
jgi:hypothetical protein